MVSKRSNHRFDNECILLNPKYDPEFEIHISLKFYGFDLNINFVAKTKNSFTKSDFELD